MLGCPYVCCAVPSVRFQKSLDSNERLASSSALDEIWRFDTLRLRDVPQTQRVRCKSAPRRTIWRLAFHLGAHPQPIPFTKPQNLAISISCSSLSMLAKKWGILQEKHFGTGTVLWVLRVCITQRNTGAQSVQRCGCRSETPAVSVAKGHT